MYTPALVLSLMGIVNAACPYMTGGLPGTAANPHSAHRRDEDTATDTEHFLSQFYLDDKDAFMTSDVGGPIEDQNSLSVGERGPTLLEDFIFRQKIQRFDHERVWFITINSCGLFLELASDPFPGPRTCRSRQRCWGTRGIHLLRQLVQPHRRIIPRLERQTDSCLRSLFYCRRESGKR